MKMRSLLRQVDSLLKSDFPHSDSKECLQLIKLFFEEREKNLYRSEGTFDAETLGELLGEVTEDIEPHTEILGFILRSTNLRNAFEVYHPLRRLCRRLVGPDVKLLLSSEWSFVPFTYPMNIESLPGVVMIGTPAPESSNPLLIPLAGHEIGHSIWNRHDILERLDKDLTAARDSAIEDNAWVKERAEEIVGSLLAESWALSTLDESLRAKSQEIFCDVCALYIFGEAYIYAFDYLLGPGASIVYSRYPSDHLRVQIMRRAARKWGLAVSDQYYTSWAEPRMQRSFEALTDSILDALAPAFIRVVDDFMNERGLGMPRATKVEEILTHYQRGVPYDGRAYLSELTIAAWRRLHLIRHGEPADAAKETDHLCELALKSIEVAEFRTLVASGGA